MWLRLIYLSCLSIFFVSCEKVITLQLDETDKKHVVEATISNTAGSARVQISTTRNFNASHVFEGVSGAAVTINEVNNGASAILTETEKGIYEAPSFTGIPGHTYALKITLGDAVYTATCTMPYPVKLDSLFVSEELLFGDPMFVANVRYNDPSGRGNAYRFVQYVNGKKEKSIFVRDDEFSDGNRITTHLWYAVDDDNSNRINSGDEVRVDMFCLDPAVYKYWDSLERSATGESRSASPSNPVSNISGGALGYFSAHTVSSQTAQTP